MKNITEIINEYYQELKQYLRIFRKKIKRIYRLIRYKWNNPKIEFLKKYIPKINHFCLTLKNGYKKIISLFLIIKEHVNNNREKSLFIGSAILGTLILLLILPSFAIYQKNFDVSFLSNIVGDMYANEKDYTLLIYTEDVGNEGVGTGKYILADEIPSFRYTYSGYTCKNGSRLIYNDEIKTTSVTINRKEVCSIYFDLTSPADITLKVMLEDNVNSNNYIVGKYIPFYGYKYSYYECDNNSNLTYDSLLHKVNIASKGNDYCKIYFQKIEADIEVNLYVENTYQKNDFIKRLNIPSNKTYVINNDLSECTNNHNERIETEIGYNNGYIEVTTKEKAYCNVYLNLANE